MGCALSRIDKEERVQICRDRKRLIKQLMGFREEFADAQLGYLRALKNTGVTLRQFTDSESLELENTQFGRLTLPPSPPPPLPPSPPPPPPFSPDLRKFEDDPFEEEIITQEEEIIEVDKDNTHTPPPPPLPNSSWDFWDPFNPPSNSPLRSKKRETTKIEEQVDEENWAETNTEFEEEDPGEEVVSINVKNQPIEKPQNVDFVDDNSSMVSWNTKDTADMPMVLWRNKRTMSGVVKELDDYFLKASDGGQEIAVLMDISRSTTLQQDFKENKRNKGNSAKVFSALSWSWSSKSLQFSRDAAEFSSTGEPCKPGAHCITLEKLYSEEQRLYKDVKDEEITKQEHEKKSLLLQKQEEQDRDDGSKTEKTRMAVESLHSDMIHLRQSISRTCSSILKLIDEELHPQLVALTSGLMHMWRTMYECHQVQNHISQQVNHFSRHQSSMDPTTEYHRQATVQLETEVTSWYNSFCKLIKYQKEYVRTLCRWAQLTHCLVDDHQSSAGSSAVSVLCEEWQLALDRLPDKVASEAIKSLLSVIHTIIIQQAEEHSLKKKSDKLEKKFQKDLHILAVMEKRLEPSGAEGDSVTVLGPKHPLSVKRAKTEALKKQVDEEKAKYMNSIRVTRSMTLNNLQTSLPNLFQALMGFSRTCSDAFEAVHTRAKPSD